MNRFWEITLSLCTFAAWVVWHSLGINGRYSLREGAAQASHGEEETANRTRLTYRKKMMAVLLRLAPAAQKTWV